MNKFCDICGNFTVFRERDSKCIVLCPVCKNEETIEEDTSIYEEKTFTSDFVGDLEFLSEENIYRRKKKMCPNCKKQTFMAVVLDEETYERKFYCDECHKLLGYSGNKK